MSSSFTAAEWTELKKQFEAKRELQLSLVERNESEGGYGMAFIAMWVVLEFFAKSIGPAAQRKQLRDALSKWLEYIDGTGDVAPVKISLGKFDIPKSATTKIPPEASLQQILPPDAAVSFYMVMDTKGKYRVRRNEIAHSGIAPSRGVYEEFKEISFKAVAEIDVWLSGDIV